MRELGETVRNYSDEELVTLLGQMEELNEKGYAVENPLRSLLDKSGPNALVTVSILVYKEAAERWLAEKNNR